MFQSDTDPVILGVGVERILSLALEVFNLGKYL